MRAASTARPAFVASFEEAQLLAVRVDRAPTDLVRTLVDQAGQGTHHWPHRQGTTGVTTVVPISDGFLAAVAAAEARHAATSEMLRGALSRGTYHFITLGKRQDAASERVTIGRSSTSDVILRHDSVSVSHAWIERDDRALLYLGDEHSTNGTQLNGRTLDPERMVPIASGDAIRFGEVETILVDPGDYWDLVVAP